MAVKLIQYWNPIHDRQARFDRFLTDEYVPRISDAGLMRIVGTWHVASGEGPYFIAEGVAESVQEIEALITRPDYLDLKARLLALVRDYHSKLLAPTGRVTARPVEIERGYKFNQHFNIDSAQYYEFDRFLDREYLPAVEQMGLAMVGDWRVRVGATPHVVSECRAEALETIGLVLENAAFRRLTLSLLDLVSDYGCKILVPSGHVNRN
ncbi:MAG: hypothetical protein KJ621_03675 [Proteobacteria bacterium]|nr:hypothetical protein [Pseudomonadota bacterium]